MKKKLSIIIPIFNEEESLPFLYKRLANLRKNIEDYDIEFFFVNDGSRDSSLDIIRKYKEMDSSIVYLSLSKNFGKEIAMKAAFDYIDCDVAVIIDADLQHPPEVIPEMLKYFEQGYDDVYGKRKNRKQEGFIKRNTAKIFYFILKIITDMPVEEGSGDFRLLSKRAIDSLKLFNEKQRYTKGMFNLIGFNKKCIEFEEEKRVAGKSKWSYLKLINLALEGITSFSIRPLRVSILLGIFISAITFFYFIFLLVKTLVSGIDLPGYASIVCINLFLGGVQLISLGIISEYIGKIFIEVKDRPLYFVDEFSSSKIMENDYENQKQ